MLAPVSIPMSLVYPKADGRPVITAHVGVLAESLKAIGLQSPITVRQCVRVRDGRDADAYEIVAGRHRFEAARSLNWKEIDAFVMEGDADDCELWEIDENFARAELTLAQKADHHARRRRILLAKGIVSDKPGVKSSSPRKVYSVEAAKTLGVSRQSVDKHVWRGNNIAPEVLTEITGSDLDTTRVLDELAGSPRAQQPAVLDEIRARRESEKANREFNRAIALTDAERFADWLMARTDLGEIDTIISWLEGTKAKDVIAALRREAA